MMYLRSPLSYASAPYPAGLCTCPSRACPPHVRRAIAKINIATVVTLRRRWRWRWRCLASGSADLHIKLTLNNDKTNKPANGECEKGEGS